MVQQPNDCVTALRALGEETRVRIVALLMDQPMDVGGISAALEVSPYNVSKHLRVLREAGLLEVEKEGRLRRYALPEGIQGRGRCRAASSTWAAAASSSTATASHRQPRRAQADGRDDDADCSGAQPDHRCR